MTSSRLPRCAKWPTLNSGRYSISFYPASSIRRRYWLCFRVDFSKWRLILSLASILRLVFKWLITELPASGSSILVCCRMLSSTVIRIPPSSAVCLLVWGCVNYVEFIRLSVIVDTPTSRTSCFPTLMFLLSMKPILESPKRLSSDCKWAIEGSKVCLSLSCSSCLI